MKTRTKVRLAVSVVAVVGSLTVAGNCFAARSSYGQQRSQYDHTAFQERSAQQIDPGERRGRFGPQPRGGRLLESFDSNGDGKLTQAEVDQARRDRFAQFDTDQDGKLTVQEYQALWLDAMQRRLSAQFQGLDDNNDGAITVEEFVAPFGNLINRLDRNNDGELTRDELRRR
jgi:Ca2+-binding EF-hand superfamily protein